jgi:hypothetical protein
MINLHAEVFNLSMIQFDFAVFVAVGTGYDFQG